MNDKEIAIKKRNAKTKILVDKLNKETVDKIVDNIVDTPVKKTKVVDQKQF